MLTKMGDKKYIISNYEYAELASQSGFQHIGIPER